MSYKGPLKHEQTALLSTSRDKLTHFLNFTEKLNMEIRHIDMNQTF